MAIYNPKRARELEAAARLAESQRQRELAKGQREQRTTEQILGLVEGLIGAAPQVVGGLQDVQAQQVLAGEKPLPEQKPETDNILENIGRFITDPFEAGVRQKARTMAAERAPAELAKIRPTLTTAIKGVPEANKFLMPQDQLTEQEVVGKEIERSPVLRLLPEQEREAIGFGETQRVQAEQAAAERQRKLDEAQITKLTAGATRAAGGELPGRKALRQAAELTTIASAANLEGEINAVGDPTLTGQTFEQVKKLAEQAYIQRGGDPTTNEGMADVSSIVTATYKKYRKKDFSPKDYDQVQEALNLNDELNGLNDLRSKVEFSPTQAQQIRQRIAETQTILNIDEIVRLANDLQVLGELTPDQVVYLRLAAQAKNSLIKAANDGYNVTNSDFGRLSSIVLDPMAPQEVWDGLLTGTLKNINSSAKQRFDVISSTVTAPASLRSRMNALEVPEVKLTGTKEKVLKDVPGEIGDVLSNLFTLLGQAGVSATGVDDAINIASNSSDPTLKSAAEAARTMLEMFMGMGKKPQKSEAPQTSQQQVQQMQPVQEAEETAYARLKQQGTLKPGMEMFIITNEDGRVSYIASTDDEIEKLTASARKKYPNITVQKYTGNLAGGK